MVEALVWFGQDNKFLQFLGQIATIVTKGKIVDNFFVINPVLIGTGKKDWKDMKDIPSNMTALGGYIKISSKSLHTFKKKPAFGLNAKKLGGNTYSLNTVYFTFAMLCDVGPSELISGILVEWMRAGGMGLCIKEILAFNHTVLPFVIFHLCNTVYLLIIKDELRRMLEIIIDFLTENVMEDDVVPIVALPPFALWKNLPNLPGLDPAEYSNLTQKQKAARQAWHLEMKS
jgi:hypothetical protein